VETRRRGNNAKEGNTTVKESERGGCKRERGGANTIEEVLVMRAPVAFKSAHIMLNLNSPCIKCT